MSDAESLRWDAEQERHYERVDCDECSDTGVIDGEPCYACDEDNEYEDEGRHPSLTDEERNPGLVTR
jgi:hypothetical protein